MPSWVVDVLSFDLSGQDLMGLERWINSNLVRKFHAIITLPVKEFVSNAFQFLESTGLETQKFVQGRVSYIALLVENLLSKAAAMDTGGIINFDWL